MPEEPSDLHQSGERTPDYTLPMTYVPAFGVEEYENRLKRTRAEMDRLGIDVALITDPKSVAWMAEGKARFHYADNPIWLLVPRSDIGPVTAVVRHLERETFERSTTPIIEKIVEYYDAGEIIPYDPVPHVVSLLERMGVDQLTIGLALRYFNVFDYQRLGDFIPHAKLVSFPAEQVRAIKSPQEILVMRKAATANAQALCKTIAEMKVGMTEWEFAQRIRQLHGEILGSDYGGSSDSAQTAQFGAHTHDMHSKRLAAEMRVMTSTLGTAANVEPGVFIKTYVGCLMRTLFFGRQAPDIVVEAAKRSAEGIERAIALMAPGVRCCDVDEGIRGCLLKSGLDVRSRTGYGCGIEWDEGNAVSLTQGNSAELQEGHTLHVIAHTYGPYGFLGMSEQITVTANGCQVLADPDGCARQLFLVQ